MSRLISFSLFNDFWLGSSRPELILSSTPGFPGSASETRIESAQQERSTSFVTQPLQLNPPYISFDLRLKAGQIASLSGLFHLNPPVPFSISSESFLDIVFNLKGRYAWVVQDGRTQIDTSTVLDLESTVNQVFNPNGAEVLRLIVSYYLVLWVLQEHPFAYGLDLPLPHPLEHGNYFNQNSFDYFQGHLELAYHLPYLPICMIALAGKALECINLCYQRVAPGPVLSKISPYSTSFQLLKFYAQKLPPTIASPLDAQTQSVATTTRVTESLQVQIDQLKQQLERFEQLSLKDQPEQTSLKLDPSGLTPKQPALINPSMVELCKPLANTNSTAVPTSSTIRTLKPTTTITLQKRHSSVINGQASPESNPAEPVTSLLTSLLD